MERFVQKRHDIVVCSHCCPSGCIDGDRISERCGMHWIYCNEGLSIIENAGLMGLPLPEAFARQLMY